MGKRPEQDEYVISRWNRLLAGGAGAGFGYGQSAPHPALKAAADIFLMSREEKSGPVEKTALLWKRAESPRNNAVYATRM